MSSIKQGVKDIIDRIVGLYNKDNSIVTQKFISTVVDKMKNTVDKTSDEELLALLLMVKDDIDKVLECD
jgi:hypothetical protein